MELITKVSKYGDQKPQKMYYLNSKSKGNEIASSTRINQWDSEEDTLKKWIGEGLSLSEITSFSKGVIINEHQTIKVLTINDPSNNNQSIGSIQLVYDGKIIQTNRIGRFPDKFQARRYVHSEAIKIKNGKPFITHYDSQQNIPIKQEFFDGIPTAAQLRYKPGIDYDCIVENGTLNPHLYLAGNEILDLASDLKKGKPISEVIEDMYYAPRSYYVHKELTEQQLILFEREYFSKRLNPLIEFICKVSNDSPEGLIIFQNNARVKNRDPKDYVYNGEEKT